MNKIPTAREFVRSFNRLRKTEETPEDYISEMLIEFAKLHVEEALKAANENVETDIVDDTSYWSGQVWDDGPLPQKVVVIENSILKAYSLENIK